MPAAMHYDPDNRDYRSAATRELHDRQRHRERNWRYYDGLHRQPLKIGEDSVDDNVVINLCRQAVDRTVSFLVPEMPHLELTEPDETESERWLRLAWAMNGGATLLANMAVNGALDGHVFARIVPEDPWPRIVALSGANIITFWDADDFQRVLWYELRWRAGRQHFRQDVVTDDGRWLLRDYRQTGSTWDLQQETVWPYALGPILDWQHLPHPTAFYGHDELPHAALNDTVNKIASDIARILRFHAYPRTIGTGFEAGSVQATAIDDFWTVPNADARVFNLEMSSDLSASLRFLQILTDAFLSESRVNILSGDPSHVQDVTNLAIRALYMDMIAKNGVLRRQYGTGIAAISQRLLMLDGREYGVPPVVHWPEALPVDHREQVELVAKQVELGVLSPQSAAAQLGVDGVLEQARNAETVV